MALWLRLTCIPCRSGSSSVVMYASSLSVPSTWRKQFVVWPMPVGKILLRSIALITELFPFDVLHHSHNTLITLTPGEECETVKVVLLCMFVCRSAQVTKKLLLRLTLFFTQEGVYQWLGPPLRCSGSRSGSGLKNLLKGFYTIGP